mgnify:CR=1 FL=1
MRCAVSACFSPRCSASPFQPASYTCSWRYPMRSYPDSLHQKQYISQDHKTLSATSRTIRRGFSVRCPHRGHVVPAVCCGYNRDIGSVVFRCRKNMKRLLKEYRQLWSTSKYLHGISRLPFKLDAYGEVLAFLSDSTFRSTR